MDLPELPWSDWEIKPEDIQYVMGEESQPLKLGAGAYGAVNMTLSFISIISKIKDYFDLYL